MPEKIPLASLNSYPAMDPLQGGTITDVDSLRPIDRFTAEHRATLADAIHDDLLGWGAPEAAIELAETLRQPGSYAVITGQQAGVFTGPLYTLYKAIGAIRLAGELELRHPGHRFVPVFWIEGDDHDFDEARTVGVIDRSGTARALAYDDGDAAPRHVGDRRVSRGGLDALVAELRETLMPTEFTDAALELVESAYGREGDSLTGGFARSLYALLDTLPIVAVSSRNPRLKLLAREIFAAELAEPRRLFEAVSERTRELRDAGAPTPILPREGALFLTHDGSRRALAIERGQYAFGADGLDAGALRELVGREPERFSPNVALRPIVQDAVLPTAAYVGGPTELAYLRQIQPAYSLFGLDPPEFVARPFVLLLEHKVRRVLSSGRISIEDLLANEFDAAHFVVDEASAAAVDTARDRALRGVRAALAELQEVTISTDRTLEKALAALGASSEKGVEEFAKKLRTALKRKSQAGIDGLESARELVMPGGSLQERAVNPIYFVNKYGPERFRAALGEVQLAPDVMQIVEI